MSNPEPLTSLEVASLVSVAKALYESESTEGDGHTPWEDLHFKQREVFIARARENLKKTQTVKTAIEEAGEISEKELVELGIRTHIFPHGENVVQPLGLPGIHADAAAELQAEPVMQDYGEVKKDTSEKPDTVSARRVAIGCTVQFFTQDPAQQTTPKKIGPYAAIVTDVMGQTDAVSLQVFATMSADEAHAVDEHPEPLFKFNVWHRIRAQNFARPSWWEWPPTS
jgi:hypothetical protein